MLLGYLPIAKAGIKIPHGMGNVVAMALIKNFTGPNEKKIKHKYNY